jgi:hypothetical protein
VPKFLGHGYVEWVHERAGRGWRGEGGMVPCQIVCGMEEKRVCTSQNVSSVLGVQSAYVIGRARARGYPTGGVGRGHGLGDGGGVQRVLLSRRQWEACLLCLYPLERAQGALKV